MRAIILVQVVVLEPRLHVSCWPDRIAALEVAPGDAARPESGVGWGRLRPLLLLATPLRGRTIAVRRLLPLLGDHLWTTAEALGRDAPAACSLRRRARLARPPYKKDTKKATTNELLLPLSERRHYTTFGSESLQYTTFGFASLQIHYFRL